MPRPTPMSSAAQHDLHDALLVAQLAAGDPLDPPERDAASTLVATCPECAQLAADMAALAVAVASEPVPARRRDFRIPVDRAAELRGGALERLLRRLALPQASVLRPVAAGVMSLGLLLVVAGNVWPEGTSDGGLTPAAVPLIETLSTTAPADAGAAAADDAADSLGGASSSLQREAASKGATEPAPVSGDAEPDAAAASPMLESLSQSAEMESILEASPDDGMAQERIMAPDSGAPPEEEAGAIAPDAADTAGAADATVAADAPLAETQSAADARADAEATAVAEMLTTADTAATETTATDGPADSFSMSTLLLVLGSLLAMGGLALLLIVWLARRLTTDPLLR